MAVGTFLHGFDALVAEADRAAADLGLEGFAQIGHSSIVPRHLVWQRFLDPDELAERLRRSALLVTHAGMGLIGDGLRAGCQLIVVPRQGATSRANPANDQVAFAHRLATILPITVCVDPGDLGQHLRCCLKAPSAGWRLRSSNVPRLIAGFLAGT